ncbi:MAG TPA: hypothetical protein VJ741_01605 [Solirubrobacteraceae bacterium]|nr:hypothetical protein [Solirubrobacteraceae bacterium]
MCAIRFLVSMVRGRDTFDAQDGLKIAIAPVTATAMMIKAISDHSTDPSRGWEGSTSEDRVGSSSVTDPGGASLRSDLIDASHLMTLRI